jgi:signal recognition particle GTPase
VTDAFSNRAIKKQEDIFVEQMENLLKADVFTLKVMIDDMEDNLSSWKVKLSGVTGGKEDVEALRKAKAILESLQLECTAKKGIMKLGRREKIRAASRSGVTIEAVNEAVNSYSRMRTMHQWVKGRQNRGEGIPKNQKEAQELMQRDMLSGKFSNEEQKDLMAKMKKRAAKKQSK